MTTKRLFSKTIVVLLVGLIIYSCKKEDEPYVVKDSGLTWETPADINEGTLLSTSQLNARADVKGKFVYTPQVGTRLGVGNNQELKVVFYPTVEGYLSMESKTVKINVIPSLEPTNGLTTAKFNDTKTYGTMTDQEGNVYKTITIGTQTWMAENLRTTKFRDGTAIPNICDGMWNSYTTGAYCSYNYTINPVSIATYGRLYNWYTVTDSHNIAPEGWHVPTDDEWTTLITELGGESVAGSKMKETGTTHWLATNTDATNESGFTSLPTGVHTSSEPFFNFMGTGGYYWSSTAPAGGIALYCRLTSDLASVYRLNTTKTVGYAVRLVKD